MKKPLMPELTPDNKRAAVAAAAATAGTIVLAFSVDSMNFPGGVFAWLCLAAAVYGSLTKRAAWRRMADGDRK